MQKSIKPYLFFCALSLGVGALSAFLTRGQMDLYAQINPPPLAPPAILFPIIWTILYLLMGISAARIYQKREEFPKESADALTVFFVSLVLNFSWSILFFDYRSFFGAFICIIALWISILLTILRYQKIDPLAAYLQIPYLVWVTFATYLTLAIAILN